MIIYIKKICIFAAEKMEDTLNYENSEEKD